MPTDVTAQIALPGDRGALGRLFQLYVHDLSRFRGTMPDAEGVYAPGRFEQRLATPGLVTFRIAHAEQLAGFAMVRPHEGRHLMAEFFIVQGLRRHGVGLAAARTVLNRLPGLWSIPFQDENEGAARFWRVLATEVAGAGWFEEHLAVPGKPHVQPDVWIRLTVPG